LIEQVGLTKYKNTKVSKLSGGQKQRVAIARALAKDTPIIIADEPTGNLDSKSANEVMKLLKEISKDKLLIVVTHNYEQVEKYATRRIKMHDGKIFEDVILQKTTDEEITKQYHYGKISLLDKIKIGVRNTINIKTKFILLYLMFLFTIQRYDFIFISARFQITF
jgi:ABC-type lipoprotein export system ATPase subunit